MQPLITLYESKRLDKNEILFSRYGAYDLFMKQSMSAQSILTPANRKNAENSFGNTASIAVMDGDGVSIGDTRSCSIDDVENTSHRINLAFTPYVWSWTMYPAQFRTGEQAMNYIQYDADFLNKADRYTRELMRVVDIASRNVVEANKNTYWPSNIATSYYPTTGNSLQISQSQKNDAFNQLAAVMEELDFYGSSDVLGSTSLKPLTTRLEAQGEGNAVNERFQFLLGNFIFTNSNRVTNGASMAATGYLIQDGNLAIFNRNNPDARAKEKIGGTSDPMIEWGTMMYPRLDMEVGTFYKRECATSISGMPSNLATLRESFSFDTEIGWLTPYNSDPTTKQTPIVKFEISAS